MHYLLKILNTKTAGIACLLIALVLKSLIIIHYSDISADKSKQYAAALNLLKGNGLTLTKAATDDVSNIFYQPLAGWPPGYSLIIAPLIKVLPQNSQWPMLLVDMAAFLLLLVFSRKILLLEKTPVWLANLFVLFTGCFFYSFISSSSSDLLALVFLLAAFYYTILLTRNGSTVWPAVIFSFLAVTTRYMYIPVVFILPLVVLYNGYVGRSKSLIRNGWRLMAGVGAGIFLLAIFQFNTTGAPVHLNPAAPGFHPENLKSFSPILISSFFPHEVLISGISRVTGMDYIKVGTFLSAAHNIIIIPLLFAAATFVFFQVSRKKPGGFLLMGLICSLAIIALLVLLSLRYEKVAIPVLWTYVEEQRYYAFVIIFIQLIVFARIFAKQGMRFLKWTFGLIFLFSAAHGMLHSFSLIQKIPSPKTLQRQQMREVLQSLRITTAFTSVASTQLEIMEAAEQLGFPVVDFRIAQSEFSLASSKKTFLLLVMDTTTITQQWKDYNMKRIAEREGYAFFALNVEPGKTYKLPYTGTRLQRRGITVKKTG